MVQIWNFEIKIIWQIGMISNVMINAIKDSCTQVHCPENRPTKVDNNSSQP